MNVNTMSHNGHETHGQMAHRNLDIHIDRLREMRWMMANACGLNSQALAVYDEGVSNLCHALEIITVAMLPDDKE
jgi:hypothetical protein